MSSGFGPWREAVLETAALTSAGFTLAQVQPATALSEWEALDGLERAVQAELLAPFAGGYRFVHDLAREAIAAQLGQGAPAPDPRPPRRRADRAAARADLIAMHLQGAGAGRSDGLAGFAGRDAERLLAWADALAQYGQALATGPERPGEIDIRRACLAVARTLRNLNRMQAELDALDGLAKVSTDPSLELEAIIGRTDLCVRRQDYAQAIGLARRAWSHPGWPLADATLRQRLTCDGAFALDQNAEHEEARGIYERELSMAATGPPEYLGALHYGLGATHISRDVVRAGKAGVAAIGRVFRCRR